MEKADGARHHVSVIKAARLGYAKTIMGALGHFEANAPCPVMLLVPTEDDASRFSRDEVGPMFAESPALAGLLSSRQGLGDRDSLTAKYFSNGGSLKIPAARAPRNLRSHDVKILLMDEVDAYEVTTEGAADELAVRRTIAHPDRKVIVGSTPTIDGISIIQRLYDQSDMRIFEVPCPHCDISFEIQFEHLQWPPERPLEAYVVCPNCGGVIEEQCKADMVERGEWRATESQIKGRAGFRINAFVSLFENASWGHIAQEYLNAQLGGPSVMRVLENTVLGKCSTLSIDNVDAAALNARKENFSLQAIPHDVLLIVAGADVQGDRIEVVFVGHALNGAQFILGHVTLMGQTSENSFWTELDQLLLSKWIHPRGYELRCEACAIDTSYRSQQVYAFTQPRHHRGIFGVKGKLSTTGIRNPIWEPGFSKSSRAVKLYFVSTDQVKILVMERLVALPFLTRAGTPCLTDEGCGRNPSAYRFSNTLSDAFFTQCGNERRYIKFVHNVPRHEFHPVQQGARTEAIDCLVYATAVRYSLAHVNMKERALRGSPAQLGKPPTLTMAERYRRLMDAHNG